MCTLLLATFDSGKVEERSAKKKKTMKLIIVTTNDSKNQNDSSKHSKVKEPLMSREIHDKVHKKIWSGDEKWKTKLCAVTIALLGWLPAAFFLKIGRIFPWWSMMRYTFPSTWPVVWNMPILSVFLKTLQAFYMDSNLFLFVYFVYLWQKRALSSSHLCQNVCTIMQAVPSLLLKLEQQCGDSFICVALQTKESQQHSSDPGTIRQGLYFVTVLCHFPLNGVALCDLCHRQAETQQQGTKVRKNET